jgi:nitroimidazol reductase NimA-like FMN-containing flavoprotein (pyridoxamine 5'-phosphate oxidase superfamily)
MITIPEKAKKLINKEQVLVVGSANKKGISNVSPRTTFYVDEDDSIYWLELFKHKSYRNFQQNPWCSVAVFDKKGLQGYQMKGKVTIVKDKKLKNEITIKIMDQLKKLHKQRILQHNKKPNLVKFTPKILYSLNPNELTDSPLTLDSTDESMDTANMQW